MSKVKNVRKYSFLDPHKIAEDLVDEGAHIVYCREALYPVLEVQARIREKSRDQLGDIEKTILALLEACPASPDSIALLMGMGPKLFPLLVELEGRGLIERDDQGVFKLSELGRMSIQFGVEVLEVDRALLLCGVTGRLLPRELYSVQRVNTGELRQKARSLDMVSEENKVPLSALDFSKIKDRRAVNLSDETVDILGVLECKPVFLWGVLAYYRTKAKKEVGEVIFPGESIDWLPKEKILEFISEPLGFSVKKNEKQVLEEIEGILKDNGVEIAGPMRLDQYQNPVVAVKSVSAETMSKYFRSKPFVMYFGTDKFAAVPVGQFPFGGDKVFPGEDLLWGRTITFKVTSDELKIKVDMLRCMDRSVNQYFDQPAAERTVKAFDLVRENLSTNGFDHNTAVELGRKFGPKNLQKILKVEDE